MIVPISPPLRAGLHPRIGPAGVNAVNPTERFVVIGMEEEDDSIDFIVINSAGRIRRIHESVLRFSVSVGTSVVPTVDVVTGTI